MNRFFIDEDSFSNFSTVADVLREQIHSFTLLLEAVPGEVAKSDRIWTALIPGAGNMGQLLFSPAADHRDESLALAIEFDRVANWASSSSEAAIDVEFATNSLASELTAAGSHRGLIVVRPAEGSCLRTTERNHAHPCRIDSTDSLPHFWQVVAEKEDWGASHLNDESARIYPNCEFSERFFDTFRSLKGKPKALRAKMRHHLSALDSYAIEIWTTESDNKARAANLASLSGVEASPESPNTRANKKAMRERWFAFASGSRCCEWHTKFEPSRNRIHFIVEDGKVLLGCMAEHLKT